jgi:hypothetical protein
VEAEAVACKHTIPSADLGGTSKTLKQDRTARRWTPLNETGDRGMTRERRQIVSSRVAEPVVTLANFWARKKGGTIASTVGVTGEWTDFQAQFSVAYVKAVASVAGYWAEEPARGKDKDGVDLSIFSRGSMGETDSPQLDVQVKSHGGPAPKDDWKYDLKVASYRKLRPTKFQVPRILVVVLVPKKKEEWLRHVAHKELVMRRCAYWKYLAGQPETTNDDTIRIEMPRSQILDPTTLAAMMTRVADRNIPI